MACVLLIFRLNSLEPSDTLLPRDIAPPRLVLDEVMKQSCLSIGIRIDVIISHLGAFVVVNGE